MAQTPLTRAQLDQTGCDDPTHTVILAAHCHTGAGFDVAYHKSRGVLTLSCSVCDRLVAEIAVAPGTLN